MLKKHKDIMKIIKGKIDFIALPIPIDASDFHIIHEKTKVAYFIPEYKKFDLPNKYDFEIVGKLSDILKDDIICRDFVVNLALDRWTNYLCSSQYDEVMFDSANDYYMKEWLKKPLHIFSDSPDENKSEMYQNLLKGIGYFDNLNKCNDEYLVIKIYKDENKNT